MDRFIEISKETGDKESFLNATYIALELGNTRLAVDTISMALKKFPTDLQVLEFAGEAYLANGYYLNAENVFARLTENNNKTEFYYISLARAQMGMGQYELAEINLKQAAAGNNHLTLSNFMLGELYTQKGDYKAAADAYKKVIDIDSQFLEAKKRYGDAMSKLKRYNEAWKSYSGVKAAADDEEVNKSIEELRPLVTKDDLIVPDLPVPPLKHTIIRRPISYDGQLPKIRVGLGAKINGAPVGMKSVKFSASHPFKAVNDHGKTIAKGIPVYFWEAQVIDGKPYLISNTGKRIPFRGNSVTIEQQSPDDNAHTVILRNMLVGHGTTWLSREDKEYRGEIQFLYNPALGGFVVINHVNMEEYVYGVVSAEMPSRFPIEALKAQAVIARTYALKAIGKHKQYGYDVCDTQNCQVYGGVKAERERTNAATDGTMGLVITYQKRPIEAVFSSNCGGYTQSSKEAGWFPHAYLQPVSDYKDFDEANLEPYHFKELLQHTRPAFSRYFKYVSPSTFRWTRFVDEKDLRKIVARKKNIGPIKAIIPLNRGRSGYVNGVKIIGKNGTLTLTKENEIKKYLAMGMLRSTYFTVQPNFEDGEPKSFIFYGGGWGHGVGLCQTGAGGRADSGQSFEDILSHYYTDTKIEDIRKR